MKLNCIIVDDEEGSHQVLENYARKLNYLTLIGKYYNAIDAFHFMKTHRVDVLLLDINMPEVDGFSLLDMLTYKPTVIFTTAYSDYALKAFEYNAVDYLYKPIRFERFVVAMEKALRWNSLQQSTEIDAITLKVDGIATQVLITDIYFIESQGNYLKVHTRVKTYIVHMTMNEIEASLPVRSFIRVHKSYIINKNEIQKNDSEHTLVNGVIIPVGKTYKKYFAEFIKKNF